MSSYNGWANYETWLVGLWLTNDEAMAAAVWVILKAWTFSDETDARLIERLGDYIALDPTAKALRHGLLNAALDEVNWHEIVDAIIACLEGQ